MDWRTPGNGSCMKAAFAVQADMDERDELLRGDKIRSAEQLVALGDQHFTAYSNEEMGTLFQHLRELSMCHEGYDEAEWCELQAQLCHRDISISVFTDDFGTHPKMPDMHLSLLFHRMWTRHRDSRQKMSWKVFQKQLIVRKIYL